MGFRVEGLCWGGDAGPFRPRFGETCRISESHVVRLVVWGLGLRGYGVRFAVWDLGLKGH